MLMRTKKALVNVITSFFAFIIGYIPQFIIRKYFFIALGEDYLGVNSLYSSVIGYLAIAELGIGTAIIYSLYKPYNEKDYKLVSQLINFYGRVYKLVGCVVLVMGIIVTPFLHYFIKDNSINLINLRVCFLLFLGNTVISYFFSYKQCLISVVQENYILSIGNTICKILICIFQIVGLKLLPSFEIYLFIQLIIQGVYFGVLNYYIDKRFNWIDKNDTELDTEAKGKLFHNIKALFIHKIGGLLVNGTDNILLSAMVSLASVAKYNNYNMVIAALKNMYGTALDTLTPSIGNLLVEKDYKYAKVIHDRIYFATFWLTSIVVTICYNCLTQFIVLWMGKEQVLDMFTLNCIYICMYFAMMRTSIEKFKDGSGNFSQDRFAPLIEGGLNLLISIVALRYYGMAGVFLGTVISDFLVIFWTKPIVTYKYVFMCSSKIYYIQYFKYVFIFLINLSVTNYITRNISVQYSIGMFVCNVLVNFIIINTILLLWFFRKEEFIYYKELILMKLKGKEQK